MEEDFCFAVIWSSRHHHIHQYYHSQLSTWPLFHIAMIYSMMCRLTCAGGKSKVSVVVSFLYSMLPVLLLIVWMDTSKSFAFVPTTSSARFSRENPTKSSSLFSSSSSLTETEIVEWSQGLSLPQDTQLLITDVKDGISLSTMFWNVVADLKGTVLFCFPEALGTKFPLDSYVEMITDGLNLGIQASVLDSEQHQAPCPAMLVTYYTNGVVVKDASDAPDEMRRWVKDVIVDSKVCPFTQSTEWAGTGLPGVTPGPVGYPVCRVVGSDNTAICAILASFWNNCVDLLNADPSELSTILLCAPHAAVNSHEDFARIADCIVQTLQQVGGNNLMALVFFHPLYDRRLIEPTDRLSHGHLPPHIWLRSYLKLQQPEASIEALSEEDIAKANYQRRSPFFMINVLRADQVAKAEMIVPWEVIEPEPGRQIRVSGAKVYAHNIWRLATKSTTKTDPITGYDYRVVPWTGAENTSK